MTKTCRLITFCLFSTALLTALPAQAETSALPVQSTAITDAMPTSNPLIKTETPSIQNRISQADQASQTAPVESAQPNSASSADRIPLSSRIFAVPSMQQ